MKLSHLLKFLLTPFLMYVGEEGGGGAAEPDRGDNLPEPQAAADAAAAADAQAELDKIAAEKAAADAAAKEAGEEDPDVVAEAAAAAALAAEEAAAAEKKKTARIPLSRHEDMLAKERARTAAAEAEIARLNAGAKRADVGAQLTATEGQIATLEAEYLKHLADGETKEAAAKMGEIRRMERAMSDQKSTLMMKEAVAQATANVAFDNTVDRLEAAYPVLNPKHADFDKDVVEDVLDLQRVYTLRGVSPAEAMQRAVEKLIPATTAKQETAVKVEAVDAVALAAARKLAANTKAIDAANKTPANTGKVGLNSDKAGGALGDNVMNLSQDEFAKIDEKKLAEMRGDTL
jgi:hypothetical protein